MRFARRWRMRAWLVVLGLALAPVAAIQGQAAPTEEPPKPALYSLPWLLRPAIPGTVLRLDETVGFYEDPVTGNSGVTYVTSFHAAYKLAPNWGIVFRESWVSNDAPEDGPDPSGDAFSNGLLGATYSCPFGDGWRFTGFLASNIPWGSGGGDNPDPGAAAALTFANNARSLMEGSLFAVNYWTVLAGLDMTYVSPWISLQVEATFFQLTRVRGPETQDSSRTNFTGGIHAAHFFSPAASLGAEFRVQRWISNASPVISDPAARQQQSFGIGPRFHFKVGEKSWFRPGLSYTRYLDKPLTSKDYNIVQLDLPFSF